MPTRTTTIYWRWSSRLNAPEKVEAIAVSRGWLVLEDSVATPVQADGVLFPTRSSCISYQLHRAEEAARAAAARVLRIEQLLIKTDLEKGGQAEWGQGKIL